MIALLLYMLLSDHFTFLRDGNLEGFRDVMETNLLFTLFITLLLMTIQNAITLFPVLLIVTLNISIFGFTYGYMWSLTSSIFASIFVFLVIRYWLQDVFMKKVDNRIKEKIEKNGLLFVFTLRLIPFMPTSIINLAAAVSSIRMKHYIIGTIFGNAIFIFVLSLIPFGVLSVDQEYYIYFLILIPFILIYYIIKRVRRNKFDQYTEVNKSNVDA